MSKIDEIVLSRAGLDWALFLVVYVCVCLLCRSVYCFALLCLSLLCFALLCFALLCFALLCFALLCFALLCFASSHSCGAGGCLVGCSVESWYTILCPPQVLQLLVVTVCWSDEVEFVYVGQAKGGKKRGGGMVSAGDGSVCHILCPA